MALCREEIENISKFVHDEEHPWKRFNKKGKKWRKRQMNKYIRRQSLEDFHGKTGRKPTKYWEY